MLAFNYAGKILVICGGGHRRDFIPSILSIDPHATAESGSEKEPGRLLFPRYLQMCGRLRDQVVIAGGWDDVKRYDKPSNSTELWNAATGQSTEASPMLIGRVCAASAVVGKCEVMP